MSHGPIQPPPMLRRIPGPHTAGMQIYLVEDSGAVRDRLIEMFDSIPHARVVGHAATAEAAIREILEKKPDLEVNPWGANLEVWSSSSCWRP